MKAEEIIRARIVDSEFAFTEIVVWLLDKPLAGSSHPYKYRLAHVVNDVCVLRFDNEAGKGDHRHFGLIESSYQFISIDQLLMDFNACIRRWNDENGNT
jgi:hypothetical protein